MCLLCGHCGLCCRLSAKQKNKDPLKSDQSAAQDEDDYGGSTDEEAEETRSTPASTLLSRGKIPLSEAS